LSKGLCIKSSNVKELYLVSLENIHGEVDYLIYDILNKLSKFLLLFECNIISIDFEYVKIYT